MFCFRDESSSSGDEFGLADGEVVVPEPDFALLALPGPWRWSAADRAAISKYCFGLASGGGDDADAAAWAAFCEQAVRYAFGATRAALEQRFEEAKAQLAARNLEAERANAPAPAKPTKSPTKRPAAGASQPAADTRDMATLLEHMDWWLEHQSHQCDGNEAFVCDRMANEFAEEAYESGRLSEPEFCALSDRVLRDVQDRILERIWARSCEVLDKAAKRPPLVPRPLQRSVQLVKRREQKGCC